MKRRQGYCLVECLAAIALIAATLSMVAVSLSGVYRTCQRVREESAVEVGLGRLASQLRADAHQALSADATQSTDEDTTGDAVQLMLTAERSVQYTVRSTYVERVLRYGDTIRHRETYRLPKTSTARWQVAPNQPRPVVSLIFEPGPGSTNRAAGLQPTQIDAAVGLFKPFLKSHAS